jgi:hypothetical protein
MPANLAMFVILAIMAILAIDGNLGNTQFWQFVSAAVWWQPGQ